MEELFGGNCLEGKSLWGITEGIVWGAVIQGGGFSLNSFLHFKTYHINKIYVDKALLKRFHLTNANKLKAKIYLP